MEQPDSRFDSLVLKSVDKTLLSKSAPMVQAIPATEVTLRELRQTFGLVPAQDADFFPEWAEVSTTSSETQSSAIKLSDADHALLDRVKANYLELMESPPMLENTVKMVVLAPLLDLSGFYHRPFRIETETGVSIKMQNEGTAKTTIIRGRIDVLVLNQQFWMLVIESKRSDFAVTRAIPQALSYMLSNPKTARPTFGMITNGNEFLFLKTVRHPVAQYANSRLFSLLNPGNELYDVLKILKHLGHQLNV